MKTEPVMTLILALIAAGGVLLTAFGVEVTHAQLAALGGFCGAALTLGLYVRSKVSPTGDRRKYPKHKHQPGK